MVPTQIVCCDPRMQYRSISAAALLFTAATAITACPEATSEADPGPVDMAAAGSAAGAGGDVGRSSAAGSPAESPAGRGGAGGSSAGAGGNHAGSATGSPAGGAPAGRGGAGGVGGSSAGAGSGGAGGVGGAGASGYKVRCVAGDYNMTCDAAKLAHISMVWGGGNTCGSESEALPCVIGDECIMLISDGRTLTGACVRP